MATVASIIPTWNRADLLSSILNNLAEQSRRPDRVIVVDNGSKDESVSLARSFGAKVIAFSENRGFAKAVNEGIRQAGAEWLLILNNDVILERNWLEVLLNSAERENAPFGAGKLLRPGGNMIDGSWDLVSRAGYAWRCGYDRPDGEVWSMPRRIFSAPMTAALFHRTVFDRIGMIDERFESYYEDVDFGVRCALAGIDGIYEPAAVARHRSKTTFGKRDARVFYLTARNQVLLLAKHYPVESLRRLAWPILIGQMLSVMAAAKKGHLVAALRGKWAALQMWKQLRVNSAPVKTVEEVFLQSEREIRRLQEQLGFDIYWRLYFGLVG